MLITKVQIDLIITLDIIMDFQQWLKEKNTDFVFEGPLSTFLLEEKDFIKSTVKRISNLELEPMYGDTYSLDVSPLEKIEMEKIFSRTQEGFVISVYQIGPLNIEFVKVNSNLYNPSSVKIKLGLVVDFSKIPWWAISADGTIAPAGDPNHFSNHHHFAIYPHHDESYDGDRDRLFENYYKMMKEKVVTLIREAVVIKS